MEQKRPADIFGEALDYLWNGLGLEEKGWKRLKKGDFKKKTKNGLTYQIWFDRSRYNYIDYEIGHGNVEVGFTCIVICTTLFIFLHLSDLIIVNISIAKDSTLCQKLNKCC